MNTLKAFHNDPNIKKTYIARVIAHRKADEIVKGFYWDKGKGCAVGCTIHGSNHYSYETELGIPEWLARVEDYLFESMSNENAKIWPEKFLKAIPLGVNLDQAKAPFFVLVLESCLNNFNHKKFPNVKIAVTDSIALWKRKDIGSKKWYLAKNSAMSAVELAVESIESEVWSAAWSAARLATEAVRLSTEEAARLVARLAAGSAAWAVNSTVSFAAELAAYSATCSTERSVYNYFADELLKIFKGLK